MILSGVKTTRVKKVSVMLDFVEVNKDINGRIDRYFRVKIKAASHVSAMYKKFIIDLSKQVRKNNNRLPSYFATLGYKAGDGSDDEAIGQLGLALELYYNSWLISNRVLNLCSHDAFNTNLSEKHLTSNNQKASYEQVGCINAILAVNVLRGMSNEIITDLIMSEELRRRLSKNLQRLTDEIVAGQQLEMTLDLEPKLDLKKILAVYRQKSALLEVAIPLKMGAVLADCGNDIQNKLDDFGVNCGLASRICNDIWGMYAPAKTLDRPPIYDLRRGKRTVLMYYGFKFANEADRRVLIDRFGNQNITTSDLKIVRKILTQTGAKAKVIFLAQQYVDKAKHAIEKIEFPNKVKQQLETAADHLSHY